MNTLLRYYDDLIPKILMDGTLWTQEWFFQISKINYKSSWTVWCTTFSPISYFCLAECHFLQTKKNIYKVISVKLGFWSFKLWQHRHHYLNNGSDNGDDMVIWWLQFVVRESCMPPSPPWQIWMKNPEKKESYVTKKREKEIVKWMVVV